MIPFNKPYITGNEINLINQVIESGKIAGNGTFTQLCQKYFEDKYEFGKCLLTKSCTDALEMAAILIDIQKGDEVIMPAYTFMSTPNAFMLRGANIVFADSKKDHPCIDEDKIEDLITEKTKAIVPVHYAGVACNMNIIMSIAEKYDLIVIEDAAQAIDSYFVDKNNTKTALGSIGHLAAFSFHETKNISSGEGGMLVIKDDEFKSRADIILEKGTNRLDFSKGKVEEYLWVDIGSSFSPSEILAAFLWAQLNSLIEIQKKRVSIWNEYFKNLFNWSKDNDIQLPFIPEHATNNAHMFYLVCNSKEQRNKLAAYLKKNEILAHTHYTSLHQSSFFSKLHDKRVLPETDRYINCLLRLPLFYDLPVDEVIDVILNFE